LKNEIVKVPEKYIYIYIDLEKYIYIYIGASENI